MGAPTSIGGLGTPPAVSAQVFETLARGEASCAWIAFIGTTSSTALSAIPVSACGHLFDDPSTLICGAAAPTGRAEKVDGGFRVSGRWQWGSGSQNARWILGGCMLTENDELMLDGNGNPRSHMVLMPAEEVELHDTWHVSGLCGTGSLDYEVKDLFVTEDHLVGYSREGLPEIGALNKFPVATFLALGIGAVCMGLARAAIDELVEVARVKKRAGSRSAIAETSLARTKVAQAEAALGSARLFYYENLRQAWDAALAGDKVTLEARRNVRLATTHAVQSCTKVVDDMYDLGGGTSVYRNSRLQRYFRDIHVATQHIMVAPATLDVIGGMFLGSEVDTSML